MLIYLYLLHESIPGARIRHDGLELKVVRIESATESASPSSAVVNGQSAHPLFVTVETASTLPVIKQSLITEIITQVLLTYT